MSKLAVSIGGVDFLARCARGHDPITFTDRLAFESHFAETHGRRKHRPLAGDPTYPRHYPDGRASAAYGPWVRPWVAPRPTLAPEIIDAMNTGELAVSYDEELDGPDVKAVIEAQWEAVQAMPRCDVCGEPIDYCQGHGEHPLDEALDPETGEWR